MGASFSATVQTGPISRPTSYTLSTGSFPGVKRPGRGFYHQPPSSVDVQKRVELYLYSPIGPSWYVLFCEPQMHKPFHLNFSIFGCKIYFFKSRNLQWKGEDLKRKTAYMLLWQHNTSYESCDHSKRFSLTWLLVIRIFAYCAIFYWQVISWPFFYRKEIFTTLNFLNWTLLRPLNISKSFTAYCMTWSIFRTCSVLSAKCRTSLLLSAQNNITHILKGHIDRDSNFLVKRTLLLTFWRRNYFFNFSTPCI